MLLAGSLVAWVRLGQTREREREGECVIKYRLTIFQGAKDAAVGVDVVDCVVGRTQCWAEYKFNYFPSGRSGREVGASRGGGQHSGGNHPLWQSPRRVYIRNIVSPFGV